MSTTPWLILARERPSAYLSSTMRVWILGFVAFACSKTDVGPPPSPTGAAPPPTVTSSVAPPSSAQVPPAVPAAQNAAAEVTNIGVHIGGGPNDAATKAPVRDSIAPHFKEFARCYELVDVKRTGDVGVDLLIEPEGGAATVSNPRVLGLRGDAFKECVVTEFGKVRFQKMRHGKTMASYSLRFVPREAP